MRVLRMGRTKMYELAAEWRATEGASGLQVIQFGTSMRVPRVALERMIGGPVHVPPEQDPAVPLVEAPAAPRFDVHSNPDPTPAVPRPSRRTRARTTRPSSPQLDLFDPPTAS